MRVREIKCAGHEGRGMPRCTQNGAYQRCGAINCRLRSLLARDEGNLPLPEPVKRAILVSKPPGIWRMSVYRAVDAAAGEPALTAFENGCWGQKYPAISQSWRRAWAEVVPFYAFPGDVRRILYTTNAIEALNSKLRRAVRARGHFPSDEAATKLLFLVLNRSEKQWIMPPREWSMAKAQFAVLFGERFTRAMA